MEAGEIVAELKHPYISVCCGEGTSYGGSQTWAKSAFVKRCGCGLIACTDLLLYLHQNQAGCRTPLFEEISRDGPVSVEGYFRCADHLRKTCLPIIPYFGMNGLMVTSGLNFYFRKNKTPMRAGWGCGERRLWQRVEDMLSRDIPVIFAIGPNFPQIWRNERVKLYSRTEDGTYYSSCSVKAHFVVITGMGERWLRISSWGREYYLDRGEYARYVRKYSNFLFSNIVYLKETRNEGERT